MYIFRDDTKMVELEEKDVMDGLYYAKVKVLTKEFVKKNIDDASKNIKKYFEKFGIEEGLEKIRRRISRINNKVPLYDTKSNNLYIISKNNVYNRVVRQDYRFPTKKFLEKQKKINNEFKEKYEYDTNEFNELKKREYRKISIMIVFLEGFDLDILHDTYVKVFYYYSNEVGKDITTCVRPSFFKYLFHINPYYTRTEIIKMALNIGIISDREIKKYEDPTNNNIDELCEVVSRNDITFERLMENYKYIVDNNMQGLLKYYTLHGSYYINQYLRDPKKHKNKYLENKINLMTQIINNSPSFDKNYIIYRFITEDNHIKNLKINDIYVENSFMSTTRDPFYKQDTYKFGFILIKIKIPKNIKGVGLCLESISLFPYEEEIILAPGSVLKLINKDRDVKYYTTDNELASMITTKYEFEYIGKNKLEYVDRPLPKKSLRINFLKIKKVKSLTLQEKVQYFINNFINEISQFKMDIDDISMLLHSEIYDSTNAYRDYYYINTNNGFSIYSMVNNNIIFMIELGLSDEEEVMIVNYYVEFSSVILMEHLTKKQFLYILASIGFYFDIETIVIYCDRLTCDLASSSDSKYRGSYNVDIYEYLKFDTKRYDNEFVKPAFSYKKLDELKSLDPLKILRKSDNEDELYQLYDKEYSGEKNLKDFFIWVVDNHCYQATHLINKMSRHFVINNPFTLNYYTINSFKYLLNTKLINQIPKKSENFKAIKNKYRLEVNQ